MSSLHLHKIIDGAISVGIFFQILIVKVAVEIVIDVSVRSICAISLSAPIKLESPSCLILISAPVLRYRLAQFGNDHIPLP